MRHGDVERVAGNVDAHTKPVAESPLLDLQICAQKSKLVAERNVTSSGVAQRLDEQSAQVSERASRSGGVTIGELRDEVQRVEEEMWMELQCQDVQSRAREQRLESGGIESCRARARARCPLPTPRQQSRRR